MKLRIIFTLLILQATIVMSQDISWVEQSTGVTTTLNCIDGAPNNYRNIWACGNNGTVLWTNNLGDTWIKIGSSGLPDGIRLNSIKVIDSSNTAVVSGNLASNTYVFKTTNKGADWIQVFHQPNGHINSISQYAWFISGNPVGGRWSIWRSSDQGTTWDSTSLFLPQSGEETGLNNSMCVNNGKIWIGTNSTRIYYSPDFGLSWQTQTIQSEDGIYSINFLGENGFAGGDNLYRTTNNGVLWNQITSTGSGKISSIVFPVYIVPIHDNNYMPDIFYSRHNSNQIFKASEINNGISFTTTIGSYMFLCSNVNSIFAVKDYGGITAGFLNITGWNDPPVNYPYSFELKQNYPNPFNPKTTIPIVVYGTGNISLKIYNSSGELVSTLLDGQMLYPPLYDALVYGYSFTIEWDGTNYPSGIYFYDVVGFDHKETKKMILVK